MKVVAFGDTHFPFQKSDKLKKIYSIIKKEKPDYVVHLGDLYDNYMFSRFDKDYNIIKPKDELSRSNTGAIKMWSEVRKACPSAKCVQLLGNHCVRIPKMILSNTPMLSSEIKSIHAKYYTFDNVSVMSSDREMIEIDGVIYIHGWHNGSTTHCSHFNKPVVHGHNHKPDLWHIPLSKSEYKPLWEMDCGFLGDSKKVPFNYTSSIHTKWRAAVGIITNGKPELVLI